MAEELYMAMPYVCHHRFADKALCGYRLVIPAGSPLLCVKGVIACSNGDLVCYAHSENGKKHFARDDDRRGMERGKLTYDIAYAPRERLSANGSTYRFSDEEANMIFEQYDKWILPDIDVIIFNDDFFKAEIADLKELARKLEIDV